ncbi:hypothetical protein L1887_27678 [Cichorium endivia]|nr:hypothetical protein L1887_27678 [Cichorium endivia]
MNSRYINGNVVVAGTGLATNSIYLSLAFPLPDFDLELGLNYSRHSPHRRPPPSLTLTCHRSSTPPLTRYLSKHTAVFKHPNQPPILVMEDSITEFCIFPKELVEEHHQLKNSYGENSQTLQFLCLVSLLLLSLLLTNSTHSRISRFF